MRLLGRISQVLRKRRRGVGSALPVGGPAGGSVVFVQYFVGHYQGPNLTLKNFAVFALIICLAAVAVEILGRLVPRARRALRARRHKKRRALAVVYAEHRARALMSELCPQGWRAQIILFGPGDALPPDAPDGARARVALDWAELEADSGRAAVVRRVWAPTIVEALDAMVADRRTDETLEEIERGARADGAPWPDIYL